MISAKDYDKSILMFSKIYRTAIIPNLCCIKVGAKPTNTQMMKIIMEINTILHNLLFMTPYVYFVQPDSTGYGCRIVFSHEEYGWKRECYLDVVEFTPDEKIIWDKLSTDIYDTPLTMRAINICNRAGMPIVGSLCVRTSNRIMKFRNCGKRTVDSMRDYLKTCGLDFNMNLTNHLKIAVSFAELNTRDTITHSDWILYRTN